MSPCSSFCDITLLAPTATADLLLAHYLCDIIPITSEVHEAQHNCSIIVLWVMWVPSPTYIKRAAQAAVGGTRPLWYMLYQVSKEGDLICFLFIHLFILTYQSKLWGWCWSVTLKISGVNDRICIFHKFFSCAFSDVFAEAEEKWWHTKHLLLWPGDSDTNCEHTADMKYYRLFNSVWRILK